MPQFVVILYNIVQISYSLETSKKQQYDQHWINNIQWNQSELNLLGTNFYAWNGLAFGLYRKINKDFLHRDFILSSVYTELRFCQGSS